MGTEEVKHTVDNPHPVRKRGENPLRYYTTLKNITLENAAVLNVLKDNLSEHLLTIPAPPLAAIVHTLT